MYKTLSKDYDLYIACTSIVTVVSHLKLLKFYSSEISKSEGRDLNKYTLNKLN